jgi:hypothetical protein
VGKKSTPKPPDYSPLIAQAQQQSAAEFSFYRNIYENDIKPRQAQQDKRNKNLANYGLQTSLADRARYFQQTMPIQASLQAEALGLDPDAAAKAAQGYATQLAAWEAKMAAGEDAGARPENTFFTNADIAGARDRMFAKAAGKAAADVEQGFAGAAGSMGRSFSRLGVNPADPAASAAATQLTLEKSKALAGGQNMAREYTDEKSRAMRYAAAGLDVGSMGAGMAGGAYASNLGGVGVNYGQTGMTNAMTAPGMMGQAYSAASRGITMQASLMNQQYANQMQAAQMRQANNPTGAILGAGIGAMTGGLGTGIGMGLMERYSGRKVLPADK